MKHEAWHQAWHEAWHQHEQGSTTWSNTWSMRWNMKRGSEAWSMTWSKTSSMQQKPHETWNAIHVSLVRVCLHVSVNAFQQCHHTRLTSPIRRERHMIWSMKHAVKHHTKQHDTRHDMKHEIWIIKDEALSMPWSLKHEVDMKHAMKHKTKQEARHQPWPEASNLK